MKPVVVTAVLASLLAPGLAAGQPFAPGMSEYRTWSVVVPFADLDLTRPEGLATLERRIAIAIDRICAPRPSPKEVALWAQFSKCREDAAAGASRQLVGLLQGGGPATAELHVGPAAS
jgi:UrcA family protein